MRKYLYYIKDGNHKMGYPTGQVRVQEKRMGVNKGDEVELEHFNTETKERGKVTYVGLGYKDFDDEKDYKENLGDVVDKKMEEVGLKEITQQ